MAEILTSGLRRNLALRLTLAAFLTWALPAHTQTSTSFQYFYDDLGQLTKVVDSTGTVIEYIYDPVGNILQIKRSSVSPSTLAIFNFTPQRGGPGQTVTIQGQAFDPTPANDIVQFNGAAATVLSATPTSLTVIVPAAATTGPISVTVAGQTATSTTNFTVLPVPVITSLSRKSALLGASFPNGRFPALAVTGINLTPDTTFALAPVTSPPAATFGTPVIDPTGTSATMSLTVGTTTTGTFALIATNTAGNSSTVPTRANRFTIVDPRSTADSDGDGVPDAVEAIFGTDPLDPTSVPVLASVSGQAESPAFTVLNQSAARAQQTLQAESAAFTVINGSTSRGTTTLQADSPAFTVLNGSSQPGTPTTLQAESPAFTVLNGSASAGTKAFQAESPAFTVENGSASGTGPRVFAAESPLFSLLNGSASTSGTFMGESSLFSLLNNRSASIVSHGYLTAKNFLPPKPQAHPVRTQGQAQDLHPKKARKKRSAKLAKATKAKQVSSNASPNGHFGTDSSHSLNSQTEMKSNDQQGVAHGNQNR